MRSDLVRWAALGQSDRANEATQADAYAQPKTRLALPSSILEISERETMAAYVRRVKLELIQSAMAQYPSRTAVAERLGLAEDTIRKHHDITSTKP